jgi:hypothetical protein
MNEVAMNAFVVRLFTVIGIVWFTQIVLDALSVKEPAKKGIFTAVLIGGILFLVGYPFVFR